MFYDYTKIVFKDSDWFRNYHTENLACHNGLKRREAENKREIPSHV